MRLSLPACLAAFAIAGTTGASTTPSAGAIVAKWTAANRADWSAALEYGYRKVERDDDGAKTYDVTMFLGTPLKRLVAVDGRPLTAAEAHDEAARVDEERRQRLAESADQRRDRVSRFEHDRERARRILEELPHAFSYTLASPRKAGGRTVYVLKATPKPGYDPPNDEAAVLTGMDGEFWIDTKTGQLVKAIARVQKPVSIDGFLATVQPGTEFEYEQMPVAAGIWLPSHLQIRSRSSVLYVFHHHVDSDEIYSHYHKLTGH